MQAFDVDNKIS